MSSWKNATGEAKRRLSYFHLPEQLHGTTIELIAFENDELAGALVGGNSARYQDMVNNAMSRLLRKEGARIVVRRIKRTEVVR